jgi:hypothetical protein
VPEGKQLLAKNEIIVNEKQVKEERISNLLVQQPNSNIGGFPLRLHIFNLAKKNTDSSYQAWLDKKPERRNHLKKWLSDKQVARLGQSFFVSPGYFLNKRIIFLPLFYPLP